MSSDKQDYNSRELVQASVDLSEFAFADTIAGDFAVSVTDDRTILADSTTSILANLLLQSDLQGRINNSAWYFESNDRCKQLDILMMTQGWRRYDVPHALVGRIVEPQFPIEQGQMLSGTIRSEWKNKLMENAMIKVIAPRIRFAESVISDENGRWIIDNVVFTDSIKFIAQAVNQKGSTLTNLSIDLDVFPTIAKIQTYKKFQKQDILDEQQVSYINNEKNRLQYIDGVANVLLDEVVVVKNKKRKPQSIYELVADKSFDYQYFERYSVTDYETAIQRIPGIMIKNNVLVSTRGAKNELIGILVDGTRLEGFEGPSIGGTIDDSFKLLKDMYPFHVVKQIDYIRGANALAFIGNDYGGGVISITTKDGTEKSKGSRDITIKTITPLGYQKPAEFYAPRYDTGNNGIGEGTDLRETLYWNPSVAIGNSKQARFNFYTNDVANTSYTITVEGVTQSGELIHATKKITKK